ncbi:MAG TPA: RNA polymerase factor sigma-54 [Halothiobacillus sp.]|nr:RNA polymerase factor sigma-54 [Halothiobacillus sp.]
MKAGLELKLGQHLAMTPQLQQSIRLLQLSTLELQVEIQRAIESNPLLELDESTAPLDKPVDVDQDISREERLAEQAQPETDLLESVGQASPSDDDFLVDSSWDDYYEPDSAASLSVADPAESGRDLYATYSGEDNLQDYLLSQILVTHLSEQDLAIATAIIESLDEAGYLGDSLEVIHETLKEDWPEIEIGEVEAVLHLVQQLDPVGVAARSLGECLALQLQQLPEDHSLRDLAIRVCNEHLEAIGRRDYAVVQRALNIDQATLTEIILLIQQLNPRPGAVLTQNRTDYIIPDVIVHRDQYGWHVDLNPEIVPRLRINSLYANMIQHISQGADASYLRSHLQEARWFIKSLKSRHETLLKVARAIIRHQLDFLERGEIGMKPLVLREIAEELGLHESTVSRVTTQKYMHTPRGVLELKYFFSSHVGTVDGQECSATAIRAMIKELVSNENPQKPLSDSRISTLLKAKGIQVARRTVAKYREAMGIASSTERKRLI